MDERPTAVLGSSDEMAIGFMKTIVAAGISVPCDVSVMGFDGIDFANYCEPTLGVIKQPFFEIGVQSAQLLLSLLEGEPPPSPLTTGSRPDRPPPCRRYRRRAR